jgi:hypothetical protein
VKPDEIRALLIPGMDEKFTAGTDAKQVEIAFELTKLLLFREAVAQLAEIRKAIAGVAIDFADVTGDPR